MTSLTPETGKRGWLARLKAGLARSSNRISDGISGIFIRRKLDDEMLEELEDLLITSDLGVATAAKVSAELAATRYNKEISPAEVRAVLSDVVEAILEPVARPLVIDKTKRPHVMLMVGVNGTGKTTTIGKLARQFKADGKSVMLAAADTFRAAAIDQLAVWGERAGVPVVRGTVGGDPASVAFDALSRAKAENVDVLMVDTAGRLQNKADLMAELGKVVRVLRKIEPTAPHDTVLVLDATTGQNAVNQVAVFREVAEITGLIMTKLDGTARGGVLVAVARDFGLPVHAIGVGEAIGDLRPFEARAFARLIAGLGDASDNPGC
ncbi:MAG: signal recognition particle-docking protein FtsY [Sphingomonadales bacterium]